MINEVLDTQRLPRKPGGCVRFPPTYLHPNIYDMQIPIGGGEADGVGVRFTFFLAPEFFSWWVLFV